MYGQQVDDFVFLKKESIFTVATSALQEVDRIQQQLVDQIADLESANDAASTNSKSASTPSPREWRPWRMSNCLPIRIYNGSRPT